MTSRFPKSMLKDLDIISQKNIPIPAAETAEQLKKIINNTQDADVRFMAAKQMAKKYPFAYFHYKIHKKPELKESTRMAAEQIAKEDPSAYFYYGLNKIKEFDDITNSVKDK